MSQKIIKLNLDDLIPQDVQIELSTMPGTKLTLGAFTLRVQLWATKTFGGRDGLERLIGDQPVEELAQLSWHVLKEKDLFKNNYDIFLDKVVTFKDRTAMKDGIMKSIGLSQPVLENIEKQIKAQEAGNVEAPAQTGENSTTSSPANTATA